MDFDVKREDLSVRESVIEGYFCEQALEYKCEQKKLLAFMGLRAWPDRMVLWPAGAISKVGITDYIELKRPKGGRFEPGQEKLHDKLRGMGFRVEVLYTKRMVDSYYADRAAELGVPKRKPLPKSHRTGMLSAFELQAQLTPRTRR